MQKYSFDGESEKKESDVLAVLLDSGSEMLVAANEEALDSAINRSLVSPHLPS